MYASALIARQRDVSVSSTNDGKSSTARGTKIGTDAPAPSKSGKDPAKGPSKAESVQKKSGGVLPMVVSFTVYLTLVVVALAALLWCTSSGQKLIAATVNSSKPAVTFAEKLLPTLLESLKELSTWIARLPVGGQGQFRFLHLRFLHCEIKHAQLHSCLKLCVGCGCFSLISRSV